MKKDREQRNIKVTVRFTEAEMQMIAEQLEERNKGRPGDEGMTVSGLVREKLLILDRSLEMRKIRLELTVIDTKLKQVELYLSKRAEDLKESFITEVLLEIENQMEGLREAFKEVAYSGGDSA